MLSSKRRATFGPTFNDMQRPPVRLGTGRNGPEAEYKGPKTAQEGLDFGRRGSEQDRRSQELHGRIPAQHMKGPASDSKDISVTKSNDK